MNLPVLKSVNADLNQFIHYWSAYYDYFIENLYDESIQKKYSPKKTFKNYSSGRMA